MTSKVFFRRVEDYSSLNEACTIFDVCSDIGHIYRCTMCHSNVKRVQYLRNPQDFICDRALACSCVSLWFDKFTREQFEVQFKYFKSFYDRCSLYQKELLRSSYVLNSLVSRLL